MRHRAWFTAALAAGALASGPARAEVAQASAQGFVVHSTTIVAAPPRAAWDALMKPAAWWNRDHTWSGDAANLSLDPAAGGCFCETWAAGAAAAEHMRVIQARPGELLMLRGALGPLQGEAVQGVLTVALKPGEGGTTMIDWTYVVGGYARMPLEALAAPVDAMLREQLGRLAARIATGG